jgi:hypothetical protein
MATGKNRNNLRQNPEIGLAKKRADGFIYAQRHDTTARIAQKEVERRTRPAKGIGDMSDSVRYRRGVNPDF